MQIIKLKTSTRALQTAKSLVLLGCGLHNHCDDRTELSHIPIKKNDKFVCR